MKLAELLSGIEIKEGCYDPELEITGVSYDSRQTKPGEAFVAIPGFASDGYRFIPKALERGAAVVICEREPSRRRSMCRLCPAAGRWRSWGQIGSRIRRTK